MEDLRKEYMNTKCNKCKNRKEKPEKDKCTIKIFQIGKYVYCKCENCSDLNKEIVWLIKGVLNGENEQRIVFKDSGDINGKRKI